MDKFILSLQSFLGRLYFNLFVNTLITTRLTYTFLGFFNGGVVFTLVEPCNYK